MTLIIMQIVVSNIHTINNNNKSSGIYNNGNNGDYNVDDSADSGQDANDDNNNSKLILTI